MRKAIFLITVIFVVSSIFASPDKNANKSTVSSIKEYWLVYKTHTDVTDTKLLKFNSEGIVVRPVQTVKRTKKPVFYPISITDYSFPNLTIWFADNSEEHLLSKLEIDKIGYQLVSLKSLKRTSSFAFTNRAENNFMLYPSEDQTEIRATSLNSNGGFSGENWMIYQNFDIPIGAPFNCDVSEDGRAAIFKSGKYQNLSFRNELLYLSLNEDGKPAMRNPTTLFLGRAQIVAVSLTDPLPGNLRLVAYEKYYGRGCNSGAYGKVFTRKVNSGNGKPLAPERFLRWMDSCEGSLVRIDPEGRFILYHTYDYRRGNLLIYDPIIFQSIDEEGRLVGQPIPLAEQIDGSFDFISD
jgi:hypothetical protein